MYKIYYKEHKATTSYFTTFSSHMIRIYKQKRHLSRKREEFGENVEVAITLAALFLFLLLYLF